MTSFKDKADEFSLSVPASESCLVLPSDTQLPLFVHQKTYIYSYSMLSCSLQYKAA